MFFPTVSSCVKVMEMRQGKQPCRARCRGAAHMGYNQKDRAGCPDVDCAAAACFAMAAACLFAQFRKVFVEKRNRFNAFEIVCDIELFVGRMQIVAI